MHIMSECYRRNVVASIEGCTVVNSACNEVVPSSSEHRLIGLRVIRNRLPEPYVASFGAATTGVFGDM